MKTTRNGSSGTREHIVNRTKKFPVTDKSTAKTTKTSYYAKNKERIRQRLRDQKQRKTDQNIVRFGVWNQESEKLECDFML